MMQKKISKLNNNPISDIIIEDKNWSYKLLSDLCQQVFYTVLLDHGLAHLGWKITVLGCNDARIIILNKDFRGKAVATNVLAWPHFSLSPKNAGQVPPPTNFKNSLGDIALAFETCQREAIINGNNFRLYVAHMLLHGCLHLLGYDHRKRVDATVMQNLESNYLEKMGIIALSHKQH